ncbi:hypothetical protein [Undibacterium fentianense]|uniref:Pilus assembly protein n=1 Tax=Undibacterium fentianense TaxID=2828728 RepID=A0A941IG94_9BURK|nr:hypothetical protein [Undibacterium fentianense]MBR7801152.1 hypothetical protein [Undibacterium fentianense]
MISLQKLSTFTRAQAFAAHLGFSIALILTVFCIIRFVWYPDVLFSLANGKDILLILSGVDVVLGPLIMLVIFNPKKKSLKFDVGAVLVCQIAFMAYGCWTVYAARPVYIAFNNSYFGLATASEVDPKDQQKASLKSLSTMPLFGPEFVGSIMPADQKEKDRIVFLSGVGLGIQHLPQYFTELEKQKAALIAAAHPAQDFDKLEADYQAKLRAFESEARANGKEVGFVPLQHHSAGAFVAVDKGTGKPIKTL